MPTKPSSNERFSRIRRRSSTTGLVLVSVLAVSAAASGVSAFQPSPRILYPSARSVAAVDYETEVKAPASKTTKSKTSPSTKGFKAKTTEVTPKNLKDLEQLLKMELSLQLPAHMGVEQIESTSKKSPTLISASKVKTALPTRTRKATVTTKRVVKLASSKAAQRTTPIASATQTAASSATTVPSSPSRLVSPKIVKRTKTSSSSTATAAAASVESTPQKRRTTLRTKGKMLTADLESVYRLKLPRTIKEAKLEDKDPSKLLTREEEILLTCRIRALRKAEQIRDEHDHDDHHPSQQQAAWTESEWATSCGFASPLELRRVIKQGQEARARMVQANMGLVTNIAKRQHSGLKVAMEAGAGSVGTILTLQDCLQEGQIGLILAAERFDASRGVRFSTYATWWIRQRITRSISDSSRIIRLPAHGMYIVLCYE